MTLTPNRLRDNPFEQAPQKRRWVTVALAGAGLLGLATVGWAGYELVTSCGSPWSGVSKHDGQCVGVTDGSYVFEPEYREVQGLIKAENDRIGDRPAVTVAMLNPLTPVEDSALDKDEILAQLQGGYVAQHAANQAAGKNRLQIRLVLANEDGLQGSWEQVTDQLIDMKDDPAPLVAVTGMGVSVPATESAAKRLSEAEISMIGAITTADQLNYASYPGFFRVAPSNRDYVESLKSYFDGALPKSALLAYDRNSENPKTPDIFIKSLVKDFQDQLPGVTLISMPFTGSLGTENAPGTNDFATLISRICFPNVSPPVFFAGRQNDLEVFLDQLEQQQCLSPVTVLTAGSDLGSLVQERSETLAEHRITVVYTSATDPVGWKSHLDARSGYWPPHFEDFLNRFQTVFPTGKLDDGNAIAQHDAVATAATALALFEAGQSGSASSSDERELPDNLTTQLLSINGAKKTVPGAGGDISFSLRGPNNSTTGDPIGKPVPLLQIPAAPEDPSDQPYITK